MLLMKLLDMQDASFVTHLVPYMAVGIPEAMAQLARFSNPHLGYAQIPINSGCA